MSVEALKTSSTGFLRELHFSTMTEAAIGDLLGEVERPSWMKFSGEQLMDPARGEVIFTIVIELAGHKKFLEINEKRITVEKRFRRFGFEFKVPDSVIVEFRERLPELYVKWLKEALLDNAYKLYEADPRIGWQSKDMTDELPTSKLFDPRQPFSRTGRPVWVKDSPGEPARLLQCSCPFCSEPHDAGEPPVWGGANLMWVHSRCWRTS